MPREPVDPQVPAWLQESLPDLPAFLATQRWFGGKARVITSASLEDACPFANDLALAVVVVSYVEGPAERYVLLLRADDATGSATPIVARRNGGHIVEAAGDPASLNRLLSAVSAGDLATTRGGRLRSADWTSHGSRGLHTPTNDAKTVRGEQSNTSARVGAGLVFKLFRRVAEGENPELELSRFLTAHTAFRSMPALEGSVTYVPPHGPASTLGVLQEWIDNDGDGWSAVMGHLRAARQHAPDSLVRDVAALGTVTAEFHAALGAAHADAAFAPEPVRPVDVERWRAGLIAQATRSLTLVARHIDDWDESTRAIGQSLLDMSTRLPEVADALVPGASGDFSRIRIHGDYHLGQTLKTRNGFVIIDFEGEPTRPLEDRREKHCVLKDVAGMFRSFEYARHAASDAGPHTAAPVDPASVRTWFLDAYLRAAQRVGATFLPRHEVDRTRGIAFFELEKAFYELEYEINNRPGWVRIPLEGACRALAGSAGRDAARGRGRRNEGVD